MKRKIIAGAVAACVLVIGLVALAMGGGSDTPLAKDPSSASTSSSKDGSAPDSSGSGGGSADEAADEGATVAGSSASQGSDPKSGSSKSSSGGSSGGGTDSSSSGDDDDNGLPIDLPVDEKDLPDVTDPVELLCSTLEREAIEATAAGLRASILDEAEAAKDTLLQQLGLGTLLGGVSETVQAQLDEVDDEAQNKLDEVDALVEEAVATCEAGGDPLSVF